VVTPKHTSENFDVVGYCDLDGKPGFKLAMQVVDEHWYLYVGHFWEPLISILEVTDPTDPRVVGTIVGPENTWTLQVQVADGLLIEGLEHIAPAWGGNDLPAEEGIRIWDVRDPVHPVLLSHWRTGMHGVHRNYYDGGDFVHVAASMPGFEGNIYVILDISDRKNPVEVGRWFHPDQYVAGGARSSKRISHHGPAYPAGDRAYLPYGTAGMVVLDVSDPRCPTLISSLDIGSAFSSSIAMHTAIPLPNRKLVVVNTEAIAERSEEPYNFAGLVDVSNESFPRLMSVFPIPTPSPAAPYENFNRRGGRFGPHNQHHHQNQECLYQSDEIVYMTWFNAGLRVYDIRDPYVPKEIGWFLPEDPLERRGLLPKTLVTQSEDVLVDARGYAYLTDKNHGLFVVKHT
jgi:hypothetical protein